MFDQIPLRDDSLYTNPEPRCPVVLLLDSSASMAGERIGELNAGLKAFEADLRADALAQKRCEIAVISFGEGVQLVTDFVAAKHYQTVQLTASGQTPLGAAVERGLDLLAARKTLYRQAGLKYYRPWLFLVTDGAPTDAWQDAASRVREDEAGGHLAFFAFGVPGADFEVLRQFSARRPPQALRGTPFREMFLWLSSSLKGVSRSAPGLAIQLHRPSEEWTL